jgi:hypothetical protein
MSLRHADLELGEGGTGWGSGTPAATTPPSDVLGKANRRLSIWLARWVATSPHPFNLSFMHNGALRCIASDFSLSQERHDRTELTQSRSQDIHLSVVIVDRDGVTAWHTPIGSLAS